MKSILMAILLVALCSSSAVASTSITGQLVNIATYVTGDASATTFNMGAMMGNGGNGAMMGNGGGSMAGSGMYACRSAIGLVTSRGDLYLLVVDGATFNAFSLCSHLGSQATVQGAVFEKAGLRAIRVESFTAQ